MSSIKDQIVTLLKQRHHSHKVALEQEKDPRSKHAIDLIARIREDSRLIEVIDSLPDNDFLDESIIASKELEEEIQKTIDKYPLNKEDMSEDDIATYHQGLIFGARHFAEWQKEHLRVVLTSEEIKMPYATKIQSKYYQIEEMTNGFSFDISVENKEKLMELLAQDGVETIYIEKVNGDLFPVANIERHPDCPKHIYEAWKRSLLQD